MRKIIFSILMTLCFLSVKAHSIWLETQPVAKTNKPHEIRVFFGESDDITPTEKWFSDLKDFSLTITSPSGQQIPMGEKKQSEKYYSVFFTPTEKGVYEIHLKHLVKDVFRKMKITYFSGALVSTEGNTEKIIGENPLQLKLSSEPLKVGKERKIILLKNGEVKKSEKLAVEAPNTWGKTLYSNVRGEVTFTPLWKGNYKLAYSLSEKEQGEHNGQPYEVDYKMITIKLFTK